MVSDEMNTIRERVGMAKNKRSKIRVPMSILADIYKLCDDPTIFQIYASTCQWTNDIYEGTNISLVKIPHEYEDSEVVNFVGRLMKRQTASPREINISWCQVHDNTIDYIFRTCGEGLNCLVANFVPFTKNMTVKYGDRLSFDTKIFWGKMGYKIDESRSKLDGDDEPDQVAYYCAPLIDWNGKNIPDIHRSRIFSSTQSYYTTKHSYKLSITYKGQLMATNDMVIGVYIMFFEYYCPCCERYLWKIDLDIPQYEFTHTTRPFGIARYRQEPDVVTDEDYTQAMIAGKLRWCKFFY